MATIEAPPNITISTRIDCPPSSRGPRFDMVAGLGEVTAVIELRDDDPKLRKGTPFQYRDGFRTYTGQITRRRRQRDGSLKLWVSGLAVEHT